MSSWLKHTSKKRIIPQLQTTTHIQPIVPHNIQQFIPNHDVLKDFLFNLSYEDLLNKLHIFQNNFTDSIITFIIPSINRLSIKNTLKSLLDQKVSNWKAIVIFDGCQPDNSELLDLLNNPRFLYLNINKTGIIKDLTHGAAGFVRNLAMNLVTTQWIGFVDDDDSLMPYYTEKLLEEIKNTPSVDVISFRMIHNNQIYLPGFMNNIEINHIGISFCYKTQLFRDGFQFEQSENEDFKLLNSLKNSNKKIVISPFITYLVSNSSPMNTILNRIIIN